MLRQKHNKRALVSKKLLWITGIILVAACVSYVIFAKNRDPATPNTLHSNINNTSQKNGVTPANNNVLTKSTENITDASTVPPNKSTDISNRPDEATITDNNGQTTDVTPSDSWSYSKNKSLVVHSPTAQQVLKSGSLLEGSSTSNKISFRLIDNVSGVIAQGDLNVIDGKFSGKFLFSTSANEGRVDIFTINPDGTESNNISIDVRLGS